MAIAISGQIYKWGAGKMLVTCVGGESLIEINRDDTGFVLLSGGDIVGGIIPDGASFTADLKACEVRFTGVGTISFG